MELSKFLKLKEQVDEAKQKASKAEGALNQLTKQLKESFGIESLQEAIEKEKELRKELAALEDKFDSKLDDFEEKWKNVLTEL